MSCGKKFLRFLSFVGPSIFAIGYTVGTGSVTSMAKAGADYGLGLLWALALSCLFSGAIKEVFGLSCGVFPIACAIMAVMTAQQIRRNG